MIGLVTVEWARVYPRPGPLATLTAEESARAAAIRNPQALARFLTGSLLLRTAIHRATGIDPAAVDLTRTCPDCGRAHGRPRVHSPEGIDVSLSHAGDWAVAAVVVGAAVGVDIEDPSRLAPGLTIPLRTWVRHEAVGKATGEGLGGGGAHPDLVGRSTLSDLTCPDDLVGAVALISPAPASSAAE